MSGYALVPIQSRRIIAGDNTSVITFSNIPQTFDDLIIYASTRDLFTSGRGTRLRISLNNDDTASYSVTALGGNANTAFSFRESSNTQAPVGMNTSAGGSASSFSSAEIIILRYTNTFGFKSISANYVRGDNTTLSSADFMGVSSSVYSKTNAISSITFRTESGLNYAIDTLFNLYGRKN